MDKPPSHPGIEALSLDDIDVEGTFQKLAAGLANDGPVLKKGFKDIEQRVGAAGKLLWDIVSDEDEDWFGKHFK